MPKEGIKLSFLETFINECDGRSMLEGLSTADVIILYVKPLTIHMKSSYCDYLKTRDSDSKVGEAQVFISHSSKYKFLELVDTLKSHFRESPDIIIWLDMFSVNQHNALNNFICCENLIYQFDHMVLMLTPWNTSTPLKRISCTSECNCTFDVALSPADQVEFEHAIKVDCDYAKCLGLKSYNKIVDIQYSNNVESPKRATSFFDIVISCTTAVHDYMNSTVAYASSCCKGHDTVKANSIIEPSPVKVLVCNNVSSLQELEDGFEIFRAIIYLKNCDLKSLYSLSTKVDLITKIKEIGIHSVFYQNIIARNMYAYTLPTSVIEQSSVQCADTLPFPKEGIKLSSWDIFINECGGRSMLEGLSTTDVNNLYVKPLTIHMKSSYCDYLKTRGSSSIGEAQVFISHAWKYKFLDVVDTLKYHFKNKSDIIIWFDLFSNNQHAAPDLDFNWWSTTFKSAIERFNHTVLVLSPWKDPVPLTRAWCLFEIYCTAVCKCKFEVAMSPAEREDFKEAIKNDATGSIDTMLATIDVRRSECWNPDDKIRIFDAVERTEGGVEGINSLVFERLRVWVIDTAEESLKNCSDDLDRAKCEQSLGLLHMHQGRDDLAETHLEESITLFRNELGENHPNTLRSMYKKAYSLYKLGRYDEALPLYTKYLPLLQEVLGEKHLNTLECMNNFAALNFDIGRIEESLKLHIECLTAFTEISANAFAGNQTDSLQSHLSQVFEACLDCFENVGNQFEDKTVILMFCRDTLPPLERMLGKKHPYILRCLNHVGGLFFKLDMYDEALPIFQKCFAMRRAVLGENHPDTVTSMFNLALLYTKMGVDEKGLSLLKTSLTKSELSQGEKSPATLACMIKLASLFFASKRYNEALSLFTKYFSLEKEMRVEDLSHAAEFGALCVQAGRYDEALHCFSTCLALCERGFGEKIKKFAGETQQSEEDKDDLARAKELYEDMIADLTLSKELVEKKKMSNNDLGKQYK